MIKHNEVKVLTIITDDDIDNSQVRNRQREKDVTVSL